MGKRASRKQIYIYLSLLICVSGCIIRSNTLKTDSVTGEVQDPVKVHLNDGSTAVFLSGARFEDDRVIGKATLYSVSLKDSLTVKEIERSEIAAYEVFETEVKGVPSMLASGAVVGGLVLGLPALFTAIFGSCPTVYSPSDTSMVLESELFSNSIAPMLETRDVSRLQAKKAKDGELIFEVRNEALETHYINQLGLLEVSHSANETIVPTPSGEVIALGNLQKPDYISNSVGADLKKVVTEKDGLAYESNLIADKAQSVTWDTLEMVFPPVSSDTTALYFSIRNSLFSTILLYDYLLASQGTASLNWISQDLNTISGAVALGRFDRKYNGLRIEQSIDGVYQQVARIPNTGPIAWRELAIPIVNTGNSPLRLRFVFLADSWRIDNLRLAGTVSYPKVDYRAISEILNKDGIKINSMLNRLQQADDQYLVTYPGDSFNIIFRELEPSTELETTYLMEGSGYYIEWIRDEWLSKELEAPVLFSEEMVIAAQHRWMKTKKDFEKKFFNSKVSVQ